MVALFGPFSRPGIGRHHRAHHRPLPTTADQTAEARAMAKPGGIRIV